MSGVRGQMGRLDGVHEITHTVQIPNGSWICQNLTHPSWQLLIKSFFFQTLSTCCQPASVWLRLTAAVMLFLFPFTKTGWLFSHWEMNKARHRRLSSVEKKRIFFSLFSTGFNKGLKNQQRLISQRRVVTYISATPSTCRKPLAGATWSNWQENICLLSLESNKQKESPYVLSSSVSVQTLLTGFAPEINCLCENFSSHVPSYTQRQSILWFKWIFKHI